MGAATTAAGIVTQGAGIVTHGAGMVANTAASAASHQLHNLQALGADIDSKINVLSHGALGHSHASPDRQRYQQRLLFWLVKFNLYDGAQALLGHGVSPFVSVTVASSRRETALHAAAMAASLPLFSLVCDHVAKHMKQDEMRSIDDYAEWNDHRGDSPCHIICRRTSHLDIVAMLTVLMLRRDRACCQRRILSEVNFAGFSSMDYLSPKTKQKVWSVIIRVKKRERARALVSRIAHQILLEKGDDGRGISAPCAKLSAAQMRWETLRSNLKNVVRMELERRAKSDAEKDDPHATPIHGHASAFVAKNAHEAKAAVRPFGHVEALREILGEDAVEKCVRVA